MSLVLFCRLRLTDKDAYLQRILVDSDDIDIEQTANSVLWNSMVHPLLNMTIYGVIWYQGIKIVSTGHFCSSR